MAQIKLSTEKKIMDLEKRLVAAVLGYRFSDEVCVQESG